MQCAIGKETDSLLPAQEGRKVCRRSDKEFFFVRKGADPDVCCYYCCFAGGFKSYSGAEDQVLKKQPDIGKSAAIGILLIRYVYY